MIFRARRDPDAAPPFRIHTPARDGIPASAPDEQAPDLVIGAISGYGLHEIECWVNSLDRSGYRGDRMLIAYSAHFDTVNELVGRGYGVMTFAENARKREFFYPARGFRDEDSSIDRFYQIWRLLQEEREDYRYVMSMDVRDVIFQRDPSGWLEENLANKRINVGSEGLRIADEPWNSDVILESYGRRVHEHMAPRTSYNAGTIAGRSGAMEALALNIFLCSRLNRTRYTDQAALNILLSLEPYHSITRFNRADEDWACQAATLADRDYRAARGQAMLAPSPVLDGDEVKTASGDVYCIVHQYDRIPEWKERLRRRYRDQPGNQS